MPTTPALPVNVDTTYADSGTDASVKVHQQHHDAIHGIVNAFDTTSPLLTGGTYLAWNSGVRGNNTDETAAIQAAINATPVGGTCLFPSGMSLISSTLVKPNNVSVKGSGGSGPFTAGYGTTWKAAVGFNSDIIKNVNVDDVDFWDHGSIYEGIQFRGAAGQTGGSGIRTCLGEDSMIRDCSFVLLPDAGVRLCHFTSPTTLGAGMTNVATTLTLTSSTGSPASGQYLARVGDESMLVTAGQGTTTLTVTRGYQGTNAVAHSSGDAFYVQKLANQAPCWMSNINAYGCKYGVWADWASGGVTIFGITGDNNTSHVAITYPDSNPNNGGRFLTVSLIGMKVESSTWNGGATSTSEDPIVLMNNPNGAQLNIFGGSATSVTGDTGLKNVVKITNGYNGVSSTFDGAVTIYGFSPNYYLNLLTNTITNETYPWYTGDDYPVFRNVAQFNYGGQTVMRSAASQPRSAWGVVGPVTPMLKHTVGPQVGVLQAAVTSTRPVTFSIDAGLAAALPASGNYILYLETEPVRVTAGQGTTSLTASGYDPGGGNLQSAHVINSPIYFYPETWHITGTATPAIAAPPGSVYTRTGVTPGVYWKSTAYDTTGWVALHYVKTGTATLVAGTVTVSDTNVTANSIIRLVNKTLGGTAGAPFISAKSAGTSFTITSTNAADTSVVQYDVISY